MALKRERERKKRGMEGIRGGGRMGGREALENGRKKERVFFGFWFFK